MPKTWNGQLTAITALRCDALVEVCYEINGVEVWGMWRGPEARFNYDVTNPSDQWSYSDASGDWDALSNTYPDNLEEHNDFDNIGWYDTFMPATQCGHVPLENADTRFRQQDLCIPVGSKGGN